MTLEKALAVQLAAGRITLVNGRIGISGRVLFSLNSDQLQPEGRQLLSTLVTPLRTYLASRNEMLMVSGFTDDRSMRTGNNQFAIDYTGSTTVLTSGSDTMAIDWITKAVATATPTAKTDETSDATVGTLASGAAYIFVGAKLTVGASQPAGTYTGSVKVTVAYN